MHHTPPSLQTWLDEIKSGPDASRIGMYLVHNGVVRGTARDGSLVTGMDLSYDSGRLEEVIEEVEARPGVFAVRVWINEGRLEIGDDIMFALVAGDIRDNVFGGLQELVRLVKTEVVKEWEIA
jgi:molybdopterin synthase catalytic subunit